tara:strand:+ start:17806 stop:17922 length:117 start_codon:yes stop_codon:yes gene_type:complete
MVGDKWKLWGDEYPYKNICNHEKGKKAFRKGSKESELA